MATWSTIAPRHYKRWCCDQHCQLQETLVGRPVSNLDSWHLYGKQHLGDQSRGAVGEVKTVCISPWPFDSKCKPIQTSIHALIRVQWTRIGNPLQTLSSLTHQRKHMHDYNWPTPKRRTVITRWRKTRRMVTEYFRIIERSTPTRKPTQQSTDWYLTEPNEAVRTTCSTWLSLAYRGMLPLFVMKAHLGCGRPSHHCIGMKKYFQPCEFNSIKLNFPRTSWLSLAWFSFARQQQ